MAIAKKYIEFQKNETGVSDGTLLKIADFNTLVFDIEGTATTFNVQFEGQAYENGAFIPISCLRTSDYTLAHLTTTKDEMWEVDIGGFYSFRTRITSISDGELSIKGRISNDI